MAEGMVVCLMDRGVWGKGMVDDDGQRRDMVQDGGDQSREGQCGLTKAEKAGNLLGLKVSRYAPTISHLFYADDALLCCKATPASFEVLRDLFKEFEFVSGQMINLNKSFLKFSPNAPSDFRSHLSSILKMTTTSSFGNYLGVPVDIPRKRSQAFHPLLDKLTTRIASWSSLHLSQPCKLIVISAILLASLNHPPCPDQERLALLQFKNSFHIDCSRDSLYSYPDIIPHEKTKSWVGRESADCCSWDGVQCDRKSGHVIGLDLTASCLSGTFPPNSTIFNLVYLRKLILSYNFFNYSRIPSELDQLSKLQVLRLFNSKFSGQIPAEISKLSNLAVLELGDDSMETRLLKFQNPSLGKLIQNLTHLQELDLKNVDVSSTVPVNLQNLTTLKQISIHKCNLYGKLPPNLFHLPHLDTLVLSLNSDIVGSLPEFKWHSPLKSIILSGTSLSGELPPSIGRLAQLEILELSHCQISGSIPSSVGNLTKLSHLYLDDNDISGVIPPSISNLTNLEALYLMSLNAIPGQLISNLGKLHKLTGIGFSGMTLRSKIPPSFANLTELRELFLSNTQVVGQLPQWLGNLTKLEILGLGGNQLEGPIPHWFTQLTNLQGLILPSNNLSCNFETLSGLENLCYLDLSGNSLTFPATSQTNSSLSKLQLLWLVSCNLTEFPVFLRDQQNLAHLRLEKNLIKGKIPQWLVNTSKESLLSFELAQNNLTGFEQPLTILPWTRLEVFDIQGNNFQGELLIPPVSIKCYDVSNNLFSGKIPKQICMARSLTMLDLSSNNLSTQLIPHCIGDQLGNSLQVLNLRGNKFHGGIPVSFTSYCNIKMINLSENQLEGDLPRTLENCTRLEVFDIGNNRINDTFPSWLGSFPNLQVLVLSHNNFHGSISDQDLGCLFCSLRIIDLSHNFYTGDLPSKYLRNWSNMMAVKEGKSDSYSTRIIFVVGAGEDEDGAVFSETLKYSMTITSKGSERLYSEILEVFRVIDFSSNNFTGQIPDVIGELKGLQALNLSNNNLDGRIPASVANMIDLESLDLSRNILYGVIPPELAQITSLEVFDVSYNDLEGPIPQGNQFDTFLSGSYLGNSRLCGNLISKKCNNAEVPESLPMTREESNEHSRLVDWVVRSCGCVSGFIIGIVIGKLYITDKYHEWFMETFQQRPRRKVKRATRQQRRC
ncbi:receptor-like protein 6 [Silene latifolia]|uniref:receptor-like protein 6 n=1 Tax=Silene latifolia TaxID=37657 RepID=UPI003D7779AC